MNETFCKAIELAGGQTALARLVGVSQPYVWNWLHRDRRVPAEFVIKVAQATNYQVRPHDLRPDIYPNPWDAMPCEHGEAA